MNFAAMRCAPFAQGVGDEVVANGRVDLSTDATADPGLEVGAETADAGIPAGRTARVEPGEEIEIAEDDELTGLLAPIGFTGRDAGRIGTRATAREVEQVSPRA